MSDMKMNIDQNLTISKIMDILKIDTTTANFDGVRTAQEYYIELAEKMGFEATLCAKGKVVEVRPKSSKKENGKPAKLGIVVHLDTVPIGEDWEHNPYGEIDNGIIYGRGIVDDKGPAVLALQALKMQEKNTDQDWLIICGSSEEAEWTDMEAYLEEKREKKEELPEFSITIDGDGVQNGCRGYLDLKLRFNNQGDNSIISNLSTPEGAANNSVPSTASAIINGEEIIANGEACHSSIPQNGDNAIVKLARQIKANNLEAYNEYRDFFDLIAKMGENKGESFDAADTLFFQRKPSFINGQEVGYTSVCPTTCKTENGEIVVNLNIRLMAGTTEKEVKEAIEEICKNYNCSAEISELTLPAYVPLNNPSIQRLQEAYKEEMGVETKATIAGGVGYNATLPNCVIFGPLWASMEQQQEGPDTCHTNMENMPIEHLIKLGNMIGIVLQKTLPLPEINRVNKKISKIQSEKSYRKKIKENLKKYKDTDMDIIAQMLLDDKFVPETDSFNDEKIVIDCIRRFKQSEQFLSLTPEQLSYIVNEAIISYKICQDELGTNLSLEQFIKLTHEMPMLMSRYNDERMKAQGLINGNIINDKAFLSYYKGKRNLPKYISKKDRTTYNLEIFKESEYIDRE